MNRSVTRQQGFVLYFVLVILLALTGAIIVALENHRHLIKILDAKTNDSQWESVISTLAFDVESTCQTELISLHEFIHKDQNWLQQYACHLTKNALSFYYVIVDLGVDPCAIIDNDAAFISHYYSRLMRVSHSMQKTFLQTTFISVQSITDEVCHTHYHSVHAGLQMTRNIGSD
jgi:hypothetical protein